MRLENLPVYQNKMFDTAEAARDCLLGDVVLAEDETTGLVSNIAFDPEKLDYDESYQNEQAHSSVFQSHLAEVLSIIGQHFRSKSILEIGCGKGSFIEQMLHVGYNARGVDPAYEGDAPYIIKSAFEGYLGLHSGAIVMRHVLEHIPQPLAFLGKVREANANQGLIYIEVPCFDWILNNRVCFDVFYEHVNYFRLSDFDRIFGKVLDSGHLFGNQYLYVVADLASLQNPIKTSSYTTADVPQDFFASIDNCLASSTGEKQRVVWGGAAKGVMFSTHAMAKGPSLDFVIDINPAKQGKFLAASGLKVLSPEEGLAQLHPGADIFVMNSNYLPEIQAMAGLGYNYISADRT